MAHSKGYNNLGVFHVLIQSTLFGLFAYCFYFDTVLFRGKKYAKVGFPFDDSYGGRAKFLTYINLVNIQILFK